MTSHREFTFTTRVWLYSGAAAWYFATLPVDHSDIIRELYGWNRRGFGAVPVEVTVGQTIWNTSIFPDKKAGAYILPLKRVVRQKEHIKENDPVQIHIKLLI